MKILLVLTRKNSRCCREIQIVNRSVCMCVCDTVVSDSVVPLMGNV